MALPEAQQQIVRLGMIPGTGSPPVQLRQFIGSEIARWGKGASGRTRRLGVRRRRVDSGRRTD
jgi:hypothetical protein